MLPTKAGIGMVDANVTYLANNVTFTNAIINTLEAAHRNMLYGRASSRLAVVQEVFMTKISHSRLFYSPSTFTLVPVSFITQIELVLSVARRVNSFLSTAPTVA
uniref:Uncharacterized protein n=1 Tax=Lygus hesperus TaxID=30085 RepID=A0A146L5S2_LYGHE